MVQHFIYVAAANLGVSAAQVLLNFGADLNFVDDLARKAHNCIPEMVTLLEFQVLIAFFWFQGIDVDTTCSEYENGTALHIAAANLGVSAAQVLLNFGADLNLVDDLARKAHDCIPEMHAIGKWLHFWISSFNSSLDLIYCAFAMYWNLTITIGVIWDVKFPFKRRII
jgi:hypothetical protein